MNNPQNNDLEGFYPVDDQPAHADCLPVNLGFCRYLPTLPECQRVFLDAIDCLEDPVTNPDGRYWLMLDVSDVAGVIVDVLNSVVGDS